MHTAAKQYFRSKIRWLIVSEVLSQKLSEIESLRTSQCLRESENLRGSKS